MGQEPIRVGPHPGPQETFISTPADIAIYGGAAGGGKTWALAFEAMRHVHRPAFEAVLFRRTRPALRGGGGLWDQTLQLYRPAGGTPREHRLDWRFPSGAHIECTHLEHDKDVYSHQSNQYAYIAFDELTHFSEFQFWYMFSRLRSMAGMRPYIRAATNPDPDSFVADLISWWIDDHGFAIPERSGVLRWFVRVNDVLHWADSAEEMKAEFPDEMPLSLTFVPAKLEDNPTLERADPGYRAKLRALPLVERGRLLEANWKSRKGGGRFFKAEWFKIIDAAPVVECWWRTWDLAATEPSKKNRDPDWTCGVKMGRTDDGTIVIADDLAMRGTPHMVRRTVLNTASQDGRGVKIGLWQDPGQAGKDQAKTYVRMLQGYIVHTRPARESKELYAEALSAQAEPGNVALVRGPWNQRFISVAEQFPGGRHDDDVDAASLGMLLISDAPPRLVMY